jgi:pyrroloquinoline quinone (PQQ) biosynthesis protein C
MGGDKEKVRQGNGDYPVRSMISYMYNTIDTVSPQSLLGMVFVLEGTSVNIATESAEAIAKSLNINTKKGFSYLLSHGKLDISHLDFYKNLVNTIQDKTIQDQIIDTAKMIYYLWGNMFDEIYNKYHQLKEAA